MNPGCSGTYSTAHGVVIEEQEMDQPLGMAGRQWGGCVAGSDSSPFFPLKISFISQSVVLKTGASHLCPSLGA